MLGYSVAEFREHIEPQFHDGMTWENCGSYWELDHIREVACFIFAGITDLKIINALANLQPILVDRHKQKSAKFLTRHAILKDAVKRLPW